MQHTTLQGKQKYLPLETKQVLRDAFRAAIDRIVGSQVSTEQVENSISILEEVFYQRFEFVLVVMHDEDWTYVEGSIEY
jgi:3-methyladenine DNA glycosylase/8-oxoguanine DNA glycosylase